MSRLDEIEAFVAIARAGSISHAAELRNIAKSALSRRLSDLEKRLQTQLITRTTRKLTLTDAGADFLVSAERIIDDLEQAERVASCQNRTLTGRLRIAAPLSYGVPRLKPIVSKFIHENPDLNIEIDFSDRQVDLISEGVDVALRIGVLPDSSLIARKVKALHHTAVASPAFWNKHGRPKKPADLQALPCLQYSNLRNPNILSFKSSNGDSGQISVSPRLLASNGDFLAAMATEGAGFLVEPFYIVEPLIENGLLEPVLPEYSWSEMNLYLVYPPSRLISAKTRAFSEAVIEALGDRKQEQG